MHIFFTGPKGVGKSTLIDEMLANYSGRVGGFRTVRLNTYLPGQCTVHLLPPEEGVQPGEENLLFICGKQNRLAAQRFELLGCAALRNSEKADLILMDELGPHESEAAAFQAAVRRALAGDVPVLGVLQQADSPFLREVASHPKVQVITVTEDNRADLRRSLTERKW